MNHLDELENESIFIIREAFANFKNIAMLWSIGKDSTTMLHLCRKAFFDKIPFPMIHIDTSFKFKEIYEFRDIYVKKWNLNLIIISNKFALDNGMSVKRGHLNCCNSLKTEPLKKIIIEKKLDAIFVGIRRDEHGIRAKERVFSKRNDSCNWDYKNQNTEMWSQYDSKEQKNEHLRIHPLLGWREIDIWEYIKREKLPVCDLYFSKNGKRYRSIGCSPCCNPIESNAKNIDEIILELEKTKSSERGGRAQDKENQYNMQKLRSLGYM